MWRDALIWGGAAGLSLSLHLLLLVDSGSRAGDESPRAQQVTRVSFRSVAAPPTPPQAAPEPEPSPPPENEVVETLPPPPEPPPPQKVKKRIERAKQPEPPKPQKKPVETPPSPPTSTSAEKAVPQQASAGTVADPALIEKARHEYLRRLMAHIDARKEYPRVARRRGIEGAVKVSFTLRQGGRLDNLVIEQGHRVLRKAVAAAIEAAQPLPLPPPEVVLPLPISFEMQFSLRER